MEEHYEQVKIAIGFLGEIGILAESQVELLNLILWVYLKKHNWQDKEIFIYNEKWINKTYFPEYTKDEMTDYLAHLIGLSIIEHVIVDKKTTAFIIQTQSIIDLAYKFYDEIETNVDQLRSDLDNAIINEDFEMAAKIRDKIKLINGGF